MLSPPPRDSQPKAHACLPDFVNARIERHIERVRRWPGKNFLQGASPGADALLLSSNDYLCLANERQLVEAQADAILQNGQQLMMSAVFRQGDTPFARIEQRLAQFMGAQESILCQSGWAANVGLMQTIANQATPVYLDILAHMSFWQGAQAARARSIAFAHNDAAHAERQIKKHGRGIIAVDAIYSTNGSLCPLKDFAEIAHRYDCVLVVDESHSLGTHGTRGAGLVGQNHLFDKVHFQTVSLAKTFAGRAGLITCPSHFKEYFAMESHPAIFCSSLLDHELTWFEHAVEFLQRADQRRDRLHAITNKVRTALTQLGYDVSAGTEQIIALESGPESMTFRLRDALQARGVFGSVFCAPATGLNRSLLRLSINSGLSDGDVERLTNACADIRDEVQLKLWRRSSFSC